MVHGVVESWTRLNNLAHIHTHKHPYKHTYTDTDIYVKYMYLYIILMCVYTFIYICTLRFLIEVRVWKVCLKNHL